MRAGRPVVVCSLVTLALLLLGSFSGAREDVNALIESLRKVGPCVRRASFSFVYPSEHPPQNELERRATCRNQTEAFKCIRESTKGSQAMIRRGMLTFVNSRAKHHRTYCANASSESARKFVEASRCIMERRFAQYRATELDYMDTMEEIARRNYTDPGAELKRICCTIHNLKQRIAESAGSECATHKEAIEEFANALITDDITIVCDEDDKLARVCPQLEPLHYKAKLQSPQIDTTHKAGLVTAGVTMFLVATLGEPNDVSQFLD